MAFDGLFTKAMTNELQSLVGGRITKIHQPNEGELIFTIRANRKNSKLLISIHSSYARIHMTNESVTNPKEPPMFCTIARKQLEGGHIAAIEQKGNDRIIRFVIHSRDEIGDPMTRSLIVELMGRHSNALIVDEEKGTIIDSMKHLPPFMNRYRTVLPGAPYVPAPEQEKDDPFEVTRERFLFIQQRVEKPRDYIQWLNGFAPLHAIELDFWLRTNDGDPYDIYRSFIDRFATGPYEPTLMMKSKKQVYAAFPLQTSEQTIHTFDTLGDLLDAYFFERAERERVRSQAADLERWLGNELKKLDKKKEKMMKELERAKQLDTYQLYGELLTANSYAIERGQSEASVDNYYEQGTTVTIPLDPRKDAIANAQRYFAKYRKAKNALIQLESQLRVADEQIDYFETLSQQVNQASPDDIEEIREELIEEGFLRKRKGKPKKVKRPKAESYVSSTGVPISVGKNNKQNDYVTFKLARKSETWLHTKDIPGSHVIIHSDAPDEQTLEEAAMLAAYFSKARDSAHVPVDYTEVRHVKKPNGAKPGFVNYFEQQTVFVTPDAERVRSLKKE